MTAGTYHGWLHYTIAISYHGEMKAGDHLPLPFYSVQDTVHGIVSTTIKLSLPSSDKLSGNSLENKPWGAFAW